MAKPFPHGSGPKGWRVMSQGMESAASSSIFGGNIDLQSGALTFQLKMCTSQVDLILQDAPIRRFALNRPSRIGSFACNLGCAFMMPHWHEPFQRSSNTSHRSSRVWAPSSFSRSTLHLTRLGLPAMCFAPSSAVVGAQVTVAARFSWLATAALLQPGASMRRNEQPTTLYISRFRLYYMFTCKYILFVAEYNI